MRLAGVALAASALLSLALVAFLRDGWAFGFGDALRVWDPPMAMASALGVALAAALASLAPLERGARFAPAVVVAWLAVFVLQLVLARALAGTPGWDAGFVLRRAEFLASGQTAAAFYGSAGDATDINYFSICPNNAPLALLFSWAVSVGALFGVGPVMSCCALCAASLSTGGAACAVSVRRVTGSAPCAWTALALYVPLFALSPWVSIPYSDSLATGLVGAQLLAVTSPRASRPAGWLALWAAGALSLLLKPAAAIPAIAATLLALAGALHATSPRAAVAALARPLVPATACVAVALLAVQPLSLATVAPGADPSLSRGMPHFLMMGQNEPMTGAYLESDAEFSASFADPAERAREDLRVALERVSERGPAGELVFLAKKLAFSLGDGTFSWSADAGAGFLAAVPPEAGGLTGLLRSLYWRGEWLGGASQAAFRAWAQPLWLCVVALWVPLGVALATRRCRLPGGAAVAALTVVGVMVYLLLLEDRARYLFALGPVLVACSALGAWELASLLRRRCRTSGREAAVSDREARAHGDR